MFIAENRHKPEHWICKVSMDELDALILAVASQDQRAIHNLPELSPEQYDKVDYMWGIMWKVRNGELKPKEVLRDVGRQVQAQQALSYDISTPSSGDVVIECMDCCNVFTFKASEKAFFATKGYPTPKRCRDCREERKAAREEQGQDR